jgi:hypothetical protein
MTAHRFASIFGKIATPLFNVAVLGGVSLVALSLVAQG